MNCGFNLIELAVHFWGQKNELNELYNNTQKWKKNYHY